MSDVHPTTPRRLDPGAPVRPGSRPRPWRSARRGVRQRTRALRAATVLVAATAVASGAPAQAVGQAVGWPPDRQQFDGQSGLLVLAASSLTDVLPGIGAAWEDGGGPPVRFSFDATSRLAPQAASGAPADVFVSADERWIAWLDERSLLVEGSARVVAENELVLVVPAGSPAPSGPSELDALERIALGGENVPAGRYAREALSRSGVWDDVRPRVVTGGSVRGVLEWVARGEVDGGVVYRTDARAEPAVEVAFAFPDDAHPPVRYWAAALAGSNDPASATAFVDFLASAPAAERLAAAGFVASPDLTARGGEGAGPPTGEPPVSAPPVAPAGPQAGAAASVALPSVGSAIRLSLLVALFATVAGLAPAVGLGWLLARHDFRGKALVSTLVLAPLVMPPVVTGFLLLTLLGSRSWLGSALASVGLSVPFTLLGATIAALIVGLPLYVLSIRGAFEAVDPQYEELSWTLGVPPPRTFLRVSLPLALPGIAAGAILAFARALGEFGATVVLAGNVEGSTRTIALAVYTLLEAPSGRDTTWILVGASVALSLLALLGFETLSRRQRRRVRDEHGR